MILIIQRQKEDNPEIWDQKTFILKAAAEQFYQNWRQFLIKVPENNIYPDQ